jgi:putative FmdB family regulatory protein
MLYDYGCPGCNFKEEQIHGMNEHPAIPCSKCGAVMTKLFTLNTTGFIIKGGSESTNWKEKRLHLKRRGELGVRQMERYGTPSLKPNVAGIEQESWSDAAKLAKEAGLSADSYQPMIEKEKRTSKVSGIDDVKWKKAKEASL